MPFDHKSALGRGIRDGIPIALGYFAVAFSLGITERNAGLSPLTGFLISILNHASAGEYVGVSLLAAGVPYLEMALTVFITNARYLLMSCSLSQRLAPDTGIVHRICVGFGITDEIFGISMHAPSPLDPFYCYGAMLVSIPSWALGTALGITAGNILPGRVVNALAVALYGMFIAIIIPPAKKDPVVLALVLLSFALSWLLSSVPLFALRLSEGTRVIILTVLLAGLAAALFPVRDGEEAEKS